MGIIFLVLYCRWVMHIDFFILFFCRPDSHFYSKMKEVEYSWLQMAHYHECCYCLQNLKPYQLLLPRHKDSDHDNSYRSLLLHDIFCVGEPCQLTSLLLFPPQRPISTICWGHRDSRLFLACGPALYVVRVEHRVASLQLLCQQGIASALREEKDVGKLNMPSLLCSYVTSAFIPTIKVGLYMEYGSFEPGSHSHFLGFHSHH